MNLALAAVAMMLAVPASVAGQAPPSCPIASDQAYARTLAGAVGVGGGPFYVAARERGYLDGLRGPESQPLTFKRVGASMGPAGRPIDFWEVTWDGAESPVVLHLDAYHYGMPKAPAGLTCVGFRLGTPPIDPMLAMDLQRDLAIEQGVAREFAPISLDPDGSSRHGVAFDRFRMIALRARAASATGAAMGDDLRRSLATDASLVLVAYPTECGGRMAAPVSIDLGSTRGLLPARTPLLKGDDLSILLPGFSAPEGAVASVFQVAGLSANLGVRVTYDPAVCGDGSGAVTLSVSASGAKGIAMPEPVRPADVDAPEDPVLLQAVVDTEGRLHHPALIGGPEALLPAAAEALRAWRAEPARVNGTAVVADTHVVFRFD